MIVGRDYLPIIERLTLDASSASMRTRIGRYYYAAFLECRTYCEQRMGYTRSKMAREHQPFANLFATIDPAMLPGDLRLLRGARNADDYEEYLSMAEIRDYLDRARSLSSDVLSRLDGPRP